MRWFENKNSTLVFTEMQLSQEKEKGKE